jgi:hypothetical protein
MIEVVGLENRYTIPTLWQHGYTEQDVYQRIVNQHTLVLYVNTSTNLMTTWLHWARRLPEDRKLNWDLNLTVVCAT